MFFFMFDRPGTLVMFEGPDKGGKDTALRLLVEILLKEKNIKLFDAIKYQSEQKEHPDFVDKFLGNQVNPNYVDPDSFDLLVTCEPTHAEEGRKLRKRILPHLEEYGTVHTAEYFAQDRMEQAKRIIIPALERGVDVLQSRGFPSSELYQPEQAARDIRKGKNIEEITREQIRQISGNRFVLDHCLPDIMFILHAPIEILMKRKGYHNDDHTSFEDRDFTEAMLKAYLDQGWHNELKGLGVEVHTINSDRTSTETQAEIFDIYEAAIKRKAA